MTFCTIVLCCILSIHTRDICEHVKLNATIQKDVVVNIQFCCNHNLAIPFKVVTIGKHKMQAYFYCIYMCKEECIFLYLGKSDIYTYSQFSHSDTLALLHNI